MRTTTSRIRTPNAAVITGVCIAFAFLCTSCAGIVGAGGEAAVTPVPTPGIAISGQTISFGDQPVGAPPATQTVGLTNTGTAMLNINEVAITGANPGDFAITNTCGNSIAPGASCVASVAFEPSTAGTASAMLNITDNAPGSPQAVSLSGTGVANPQPTLIYLSPASATAGASSQILTLNGSGFASGSVVTYDGSAHAATLVSLTQLSITLSTADQATAGSYPVVVTNPGPGGGAATPLDFVVTSTNPVPSLTSLSPPTSVAGASAQTLTLSGTNFNSGSTVTYDGAGHASMFVSATQLTITLSTADQAAAGSYPVVVTNPGPGGGAATPLDFVVTSSNPVPSLTSLSPLTAVAGAGVQTLMLSGSNFISASTVTYNGVNHAATYVSSTQLTIMLSVADQATAGSYPVVVTNPGPGGGTSTPLYFVLDNPQPNLTSLSPTSSSAGAGAQTLAVTGTNFESTSTVTYNGVGHASTFVSSTQLTITLSAADQATAGSYAVVVTNPGPGGGSSSPLDFSVSNLTVGLTSLTPQTAIAGAGARTLVLSGTNYESTSTVTYNGVSHAATFVSPTQLTITLSVADQATAGSYPVVVTNPGPGGGASTPLNFVVDNPQPNLTSLSPAFAGAGAGGQTLTLNGSNFASSSTVTYNGVSHATTFVGPTQLSIILSGTDEAIAGSYPVVVSNPGPGGGASGAVNFVVNNPTPGLASLSPASVVAGSAAQTLTLNGTNFLSSSTVTYNGVNHAATYVSSTQLTITLSVANQVTAGSYPVVVTNPGPGGGTSTPLNFVVTSNNPAPNLTGVSPSSAVAGAAAQTLTLTGTNFLSGSTVTYNGVSHAATFVSPTQLTITLSVADQATAGSYPVVVTNSGPGGGASGAVNFVVNNPTPGLASLSPASVVAGSAAQTLTLNGTNFLSSSTVTYNGVSHAATYVSSTKLTITLSAADQATAGSYAVVVTNPGPGGGTSTPLNFVITSNNPVPNLTSLSPASAVAGASAQTLTVTGTNFLSTSTVTYNGVGHTATFVSSTKLTITLSVADQATTGSFPVVVTNPGPGGGASSAVNFTVTAGTGPIASLSTTTVNFGGQPLGVLSAPQSVTITNNGNANLNITNIAISGTNAGDFAETDTCGSPVAAGNNCVINLTFTSSTTQTETAAVMITDNASGSPQQVDLMGTGASVAVNWTSAEQTIDGFGAASASYTLTLSSSLMDFFYSNSGINLNLIRLQIYPSVADCASDLGSGACVNVASGPTLATADLAIAQAAVARGATVWASEWSPPDAMKSNDNFDAGGAFLGGTANFTSLASIQASFVTWMNTTYGIRIYAISPQNEPNISQSYPSCTWTAQQFHDYIPYLQAALSAAGYGSVKIMVAEESDWGNSYSTTAMNDSTVASDISILASHAYGSSAAPLSWNNFTNQHVWETEVSDFNPYDGSITSGLTYATEISDWLTIANVNSWNYWLLSAARGFTDNEALTDVSNNIAKRAYALGNFSKFVRPGWHRVDVANTGSLLVTAFESADGTQSAMVVVNSGSSDSPQVINVGTQMGTTVVPWVTSSSQNLAQQSAVTISGGTLSYTIPANSIVTFVGQTSN